MLNHKFIGNPESDTIVIFLHEGLGCIEMWRDYPNKVCELLNCNGLIYDRAGYGQSKGSLLNRRPNYMHIAAEELKQLIRQLKLEDKKIILYGHSDGGSIALIFAAKYPKNVIGLVTEAAHVFVEDETLAGIKPAHDAFLQGKLVGLKKYHGERYAEVVEAWINIWNSPYFRDWNIEKELKSIICPQLVIQGMDDQYGTLKQVESIAENTQGKTVLFTPENCGHAPFKENADDVLKQLKLFLS